MKKKNYYLSDLEMIWKWDLNLKIKFGIQWEKFENKIKIEF